jgi:pilus assembly protein Flp/PilA
MLAYIRKVTAVRKDDGASAVEYGLLVAAIAALIVIIVFALGGLVKGVFKDTCDKIKNGSPTGSAANSASCNQ